MSLPNQNYSPPVFVLKSVLPPLDEYQEHLKDIWNNRQFTNCGPKHAELKKSLCHFMGVENCALVGNGTFALMAALAACNLGEGEVITTPYTFVATAHCLQPLGLKPRFVDIEPDGLTIDPDLIVKEITPATKAILGVHVYGNPCAVEALEKIGRKHNLKIIYDAAHAFGVTYNGQSVLNYGDASCMSFHATKAFHTFEGGAVVSKNTEICEFVRRYRNFGISSPEGTIAQQGLNTKMSELHAAAGLVNLAHYPERYVLRKNLYERYLKALTDVPGFSFVSFKSQETANYNYCPVLIEKDRDALFDAFTQENIFTRKYFYPLLTDMPAYAEYKQHFPVASRVAKQILCLPIYPDLSAGEQDKVISIVKNFIGKT